MHPTRSYQHPEPENQQLTADQIKKGIKKLRRRIADVKALDPQNIRPDDQAVTNIERQIVSTIQGIYGTQSRQYQDNQHHQIWHGPMHMMMTQSEIQRRFTNGIPQTVKLLEGLINDLKENLEDADSDPTIRARITFEGLELHPRISAVSADLFRNGHYRNAVLDACLALVNYVKEKSRRHDLDGAPLMRTVFSKNKPVLAFNEAKDQSDQDEQEGIMHLFEGAVLAFRNPRAHTLDPDTPENALQCIGFLSMLANLLDKARQNSPNGK